MNVVECKEVVCTQIDAYIAHGSLLGPLLGQSITQGHIFDTEVIAALEETGRQCIGRIGTVIGYGFGRNAGIAYVLPVVTGNSQLLSAERSTVVPEYLVIGREDVVAELILEAGAEIDTVPVESRIETAGSNRFGRTFVNATSMGTPRSR